ncbi:MAG: hypothetical protein M3N21_06685 [Actinomycetota bacterium]|nr:hypothetical protein [Actinomycetota bacterium]
MWIVRRKAHVVLATGLTTVLSAGLVTALAVGTAGLAKADPSPVAPVTDLVPPHPGPPVCC